MPTAEKRSGNKWRITQQYHGKRYRVIIESKTKPSKKKMAIVMNQVIKNETGFDIGITFPKKRYMGNYPCYVYYILNEEKDKIKIGVSKNVLQRCKSLQTSSGEELKLLHFIEFPSRHKAIEAETKLHNIFYFYRKNPNKDTRITNTTEWFDAKIVDFLMTNFDTKDKIFAYQN